MKRLDEADAEARRREAREILVKSTVTCLFVSFFLFDHLGLIDLSSSHREAAKTSSGYFQSVFRSRSLALLDPDPSVNKQ
jgi:hypothetical protein